MIQRTNESNVYGPKYFSNIHKDKISEVHIGEKYSLKNYRVFTSSNNKSDQNGIYNVSPFRMVILVEIYEEKKKNVV